MTQLVLQKYSTDSLVECCLGEQSYLGQVLGFDRKEARFSGEDRQTSDHFSWMCSEHVNFMLIVSHLLRQNQSS